MRILLTSHTGRGLRVRETPSPSFNLRLHTRIIEPTRAQAAAALALQRRLFDLVNEPHGLTPGNGLTPAEFALMRQTARRAHNLQPTLFLLGPGLNHL